MMFFKCKHPASRLGVQKKETIQRLDDEFDVVTYHLVCRSCGEILELKYAKLIGGVESFLSKENGK